MRTIGTLAILVLPITAAAQPAQRHASNRICQNTTAHQAAAADRTARFRRLGDLPPANEVLAVLRTEDGCSKPVIVRYGIGSHARAPVGGAPR